jgi:hypothetical protein
MSKVINIRAAMSAFSLALTLTMSAWAQSVTLVPAVQSAVNKAIGSMGELKGTVVAGVTPFYAPRTNRTVFYEVKLVSATGVAKGYLLVTPDGKIREMTTKGITKAERLARLVQGRRFKAVRFSPHFAVAEDDNGRVIAQLGDTPRPYSDQFLSKQLPWPQQTRWSLNPVQPVRGDANIYRGFTTLDQAYAGWAADYDRLFLNRPNVARADNNVVLGQVAGSVYGQMRQIDNPGDASTGGPDLENIGIPSGAGMAYYEAIGRNRTVRMKQLGVNDALNDRSHKTGCGPTAVFNMLAWHDNNWVPSLLDGSASNLTGPYSTAGMASYTKMLRDVMGTFQSPADPDLGATFPWDMHQGVMHKQNYGGFNVDALYTYQLPFDSSAREIAKMSIRDLGKPAIIGYWESVHYDLAYKYQTWGGDDPGLFYVDMDDEDGMWVAGDDLFYAATVFNYEEKGSAIKNGSFESGNAEWNGAGARGVALRNVNSHQGLAHGWIGSNAGATGSLLRVMPTNANAIGWEVEAYFKKPAGARAFIKILNASLVVERSVSVDAPANTWTKVKLTGIGNSPAIRFILITVEADSGNNVTLVDSVRVVPIHGNGGSGTQPCIPNKPGGGLDEGCDWP